MGSSKEAKDDSMESIKKMLKFLDMVPHKYKVGPWSPVAHLVILSYGCFLFLTMQIASDEYVEHDYIHSPNSWIQMYRLIFGIYGVVVSALVFHNAGIWPLVSYTLTSWNLMSLRLLFAFAAGAGVEDADIVANFLRFPAMAGCSITVSIWWAVLVPLIDHLLSKDTNPTSRELFWKWNMSPMLINVHLLNLPIVGIEFLVTGSRLSFFDLWMALAVALCYCLFYLNVLDPRGLHFYIILTPRAAWSIFSYILILSSYYGFYLAWNHALTWYGA